MIVEVFPRFSYSDAGLSGLVLVGDGRSGDLGCIIGYSVLSHGVNNRFAVGIFRKVLESVAPVSFFVCFYYLTVCFLTIGKKIYGDAFRAFSVLVVSIVPDLFAGDFC